MARLTAKTKSATASGGSRAGASRKMPRIARIAQRLGRDPVLAIGAVQVATEHAETVSQRARIGVMEGLLFDRVALHSGGVTPGYLELARFIEANFADAQLPIGNVAAVAASETAYKTPVELFVKLAFANIGVKNILERGHNPPKIRNSKIEIRSPEFGIRNPWR